jgi:hypothetical protein
MESAHNAALLKSERRIKMNPRKNEVATTNERTSSKAQTRLYSVTSILPVVLFLGGWLMAQSSPDQPGNAKNGRVTVQGCVTRLSGDFVLTQTDPGNTYVLHASDKLKLGKYLGQQVKVVGTKSNTLSDSSDASRSAPSVTITVNSITTVSKECQ